MTAILAGFSISSSGAMSPDQGPGRGVYFNRPTAQWMDGLRELIMDDPEWRQGS